MKVLSVLNPYRDTALLYRKAWWKGVLPLPYREKDPPPTHWTGHRAGYPDLEQIKEWCEDGKKHNICIRLAGVDAEHEIIAIDVDDYVKGGKKKNGGQQLQVLSEKLGPLPDTWISSARTDGVSGIRYFLVPRHLAYRGKVDKDIEVISKGYRFAAVWPSVHPNGGTYWWFPPGVAPSKDGREVWDGQLPIAKDLPLLPETWLDYLSQGRMRSGEADLIDMDSSVDDVYVWADDTFYGDSDTEPCDKMREKLEKHKKLIEDEATSHDKLINAHFNLMRLAAEGHLGWNVAVNELEKKFIDVMEARNKRGAEVYGEIFRSRINGLRKVKAQVEARLAIGAAAVDPACVRTGACGEWADDSGGGDDGPPDDPLGDVPRGPIRPVDSYEMNDDGNAEHFVDRFSSSGIGPSVRYAEGKGWLIWHEGRDGVSEPHWEVDVNGDQSMRRMWQKVKKRQQDYIDTALRPDYEQQFQQWGGNGPMPGSLKAAKAKLDKWKKFVEANGNNRNSNNAIEAVKSIPNVLVSVNELDKNPYLLGVANGVVELDGENVRLRKAIATDYITLNTGISWERPSDLASQTWQNYLDTFLPDIDLQRATQVALGHTLIGGNPEKIMIVLKGDPNTGKSTMVTALLTALGEYAESVNQSIFQQHKLNPILADSINKRVIVCSEFDEEDKLSASVVKGITGGHDEIRAEKKGSNAKFAGIPQFVPILATNETPSISGADKALQNRLYVIPFNISPERIQKERANQVKAICGPAILSWLIDGYVEYRKLGGLPVHNEVRKSTDEFVSELDEIATFASECLVKSSDGEVIRIPEMYEKFKRWCDQVNIQRRDVPNSNKFSRRLKALGWQTKLVRQGDEVFKAWIDVKLKKIAGGSNVIAMDPRVWKQ